MKIDNFTFVTIGLTDGGEDLKNTYESIADLIQEGANWIVVLHESEGVAKNMPITTLVVGEDSGLYDALNIGINHVTTDSFMFLHSGDTLITNSFNKAFDLLNIYDVVLGGAQIGNRTHLSRFWRPWMFNFYVQPPHLPILYETKSVSDLKFSLDIDVVADFYFLKQLFKKDLRWIHSNEIYVSMSLGGLTTNGWESARRVTRSFNLKDGLKAYILAPFRLALKTLIK